MCQQSHLLSWVLCSVSYKAAIKMLAGLNSFLELMMLFQAHMIVGGIHFLATAWLQALASPWLLSIGHHNVLEATCNSSSRVLFHRQFKTQLFDSSRPAGESPFAKSIKMSYKMECNLERQPTQSLLTYSTG